MLTTNIDEFITALDIYANEIPTAVEGAVDAATNVYHRQMEKQIGNIYRQPLPESMAKRGQQRTGQLMDGLTSFILGSGVDAIGIVEIRGPARNYARRRNYLESIPNHYFEESIAFGSSEAAMEAQLAFARILDL